MQSSIALLFSQENLNTEWVMRCRFQKRIRMENGIPCAVGCGRPREEDKHCKLPLAHTHTEPRTCRSHPTVWSQGSVSAVSVQLSGPARRERSGRRGGSQSYDPRDPQSPFSLIHPLLSRDLLHRGSRSPPQLRAGGENAGLFWESTVSHESWVT